MSNVKSKLKRPPLLEGARKGEKVGITARRKLAPPIVPDRSLAEVFANIDKIRRSAKPLKGITIKDLIEDGRR
jgi:hypothetical protein